MKLSYCISIKNRKSHLIKTLPESVKNLLNLKGYLYEICICDYSSSDDLETYIKEFLNLTPNIEIHYKLIKYRHSYHHSRAKNISHKMASGDILINLDADNIVTTQYHKLIYKSFKNGADLVWPGISKYSVGGGIGRIAIKKDIFLNLGGYDEEIVGWGYEDMDLLERVRCSGYNVTTIRDSTVRFIRHEDCYRYENTEEKIPINITAERNKKYIDNKLSNKEYISNIGRTWGV